MTEQPIEDVSLGSNGSKSGSTTQSSSSSNCNDLNYAQISVGKAEKHGEGFKDAYVTYQISTRFVDGSEAQVRRRYQDFLWLLTKFEEQLPSGLVVPPLPDRSVLGYWDRFTPEFIRRRQLALERFLGWVARHPVLGGMDCFRHFLSQPALASEATASNAAPKEEGSPKAGVAAVIEQISEAVLNSFGKNRPIDERFVQMKRTNALMEGHYAKLALTHAKLTSAQKGKHI